LMRVPQHAFAAAFRLEAVTGWLPGRWDWRVGAVGDPGCAFGHTCSEAPGAYKFMSGPAGAGPVQPRGIVDMQPKAGVGVSMRSGFTELV
jgi:hypothetical protein